MSESSFKPLELSANQTVFARKHGDALAECKPGHIGWLEIPVTDLGKWGVSLSEKDEIELIETKSSVVRIELLYSVDVVPAGWVQITTHQRARRAAKEARSKCWKSLRARFPLARQTVRKYRSEIDNDGPVHAFVYVH